VPRRNRLALALGDDRLKLFIVDRVQGGFPRAPAHDDLAWLGRRLESGRRVRHVAHHRVLTVFGRPDESGHHLTRVDPDMDRAVDGRIGWWRYRGSHLQRATDGALGIVFVGDRRAEHRHDAVAQHVHDGSTESDHVVAHLSRDVGADCFDLFRV
jgi:hypothetical protein